MGGWVGLRASLDFMEEKKIVFYCRRSKPESSVVSPAAD
jgi:hypothetical protein